MTFWRNVLPNMLLQSQNAVLVVKKLPQNFYQCRRNFPPYKAQCMKWQHFYHKCHCFVGYWHMFTIKHYDTLIYFPDQNFNFSNPFLCNFDLRWQILIWSYLIDNHFTEITVHLPCFLQFCSPKLWFEILSMILSEIGATKCHFIN